MSESFGNSINRVPKSEALNEVETLAYLRENGIKPLTDWKPHQPVLYVLEEQTRSDTGPYASRELYQRPSIVRIDDPTNIKFDQVTIEEDFPDRRTCKLISAGRADYFVIDRKTGKPARVKVSLKTGEEHKELGYNVRPDTLFMTNDSLFSAGDEIEL